MPNSSVPKQKKQPRNNPGLRNNFLGLVKRSGSSSSSSGSQEGFQMEDGSFFGLESGGVLGAEN